MKSILKYSVFVLWMCCCKNAFSEDVNTLYKRAQFFEKINEDSAKYYYELIFTAATTLKKEDEEIYGKSLRKFALLNAVDKEESKNIDLCEQAILFFQKINNQKEVGITYNAMANIYQQKGFFDLAIENYQKAASIFKSIEFFNGLMICFSNIASIYTNTEQHNKALHYNLLAYQTSIIKNDTFSEGMIAHDVSISFAKNNELDSSKQYASLALNYGKSIQNNFVIGYAYKAFYEYYKIIKNWQKAYENAQQSLNYILKTAADYDMCFAYCNMAESALNLQKNTEATINSKQAEILAKKVNSFQLYKRVYALQKEIAAANGDFKNAFFYAKLYQQFSDSVFYEKRNNTLNELETKYQTAEKENKIAKQKIEIQQQELKAKQARIRFIIACILFGVLLIGALFVYLFLQQRQKLLQNKIITIEQQKKIELTQAIIDGEELERIRLAKELHDGIGGLMSMIKLQFTNFKKINTEIQKSKEYNSALDLLNTASQDIRKISHALMPSALERLGLVDAVEQFCTQMQTSSHLEIDFQHYGFDDRLPQKLELLVYRIIQELLNNIIKHANASEVIVQLTKHNHQLTLTIEDDGNGFDSSTIKNKDGIGLNSMQKRIELLGGKMDIDTAIGKGTAINIDLQINHT